MATFAYAGHMASLMLGTCVALWVSGMIIQDIELIQLQILSVIIDDWGWLSKTLLAPV